MKKKIIITLLASGILAFTVSCTTIFGGINVGQPKYKTVKQENDFEIREYDSLMIASAHIDADYEDYSSKAFRKLAAYIFGDNRSRIKSDKSEEIEMTAPVLQERTQNGWTMSFIMPSKWTEETLPLPDDQSIKISTVSNKKYAAIRYSGKLTEEQMIKHEQKLRGWIKDSNFEISGSVLHAAYNPPWTIPSQRRNEVLIEIQ